MNTDIRLSVSFRGHRKRKRLRKVLGPDSTDFLIDLAVSRPTLYKWIQDGKFPPPTKWGRISVWPVDVIRQEIVRRGGPVLQQPVEGI